MVFDAFAVFDANTFVSAFFILKGLYYIKLLFFLFEDGFLAELTLFFMWFPFLPGVTVKIGVLSFLNNSGLLSILST